MVDQTYFVPLDGVAIPERVDARKTVNLQMLDVLEDGNANVLRGFPHGCQYRIPRSPPMRIQTRIQAVFAASTLIVKVDSVTTMQHLARWASVSRYGFALAVKGRGMCSMLTRIDVLVVLAMGVPNAHTAKSVRL